jgi:5-methylcytosine-specific restriction endonuclease McrA
MSDRRYSTARWQRLRKAVLNRDGHICQIQGPRCRRYANTAHHVLPSSTHPHLFFQPSNVVAACGACNFGEGAGIAAGNRRAAGERIAELERRNWHLQEAVEELERRCEELGFALAAATTGKPARKPAIH